MFIKIIVALLALHQVECCFKWNTASVLTETPLTKAGLPTVNLRNPKASSELAKALKDWGFSYVTGHSVPDDVIKNANEQSKSFFDLPTRVKRSLEADRGQEFAKTSRGYTGLKLEQLNAKGKPDLKEVLDIGYVSKGQKKLQQHYLGENKWLNITANRTRRDVNGGLQDTTENYSEHASMVAQNVLSLTAKGLGCEHAFEPAFGPDALQVQRLTRYPPTHEIDETEPGQIGAGVHSDYGGITVLYAEGPGLSVLKPNRTSKTVNTGTFSPELKVPNSGQWVNVDSIPGTFIVMAGEALQRLSNGQIYAAKHKVDFTGSQSRYSLAFFYDPNPNAVLEPLQCFKKNGNSLYKAKVAGHKGFIKKLIKKRKTIYI